MGLQISLRLVLCFLVGCVVQESMAAEPFDTHGPLRVSARGTHLEHADGTPFFFLADTCWCGPALSTAEDWRIYLAERKRQGFTAIQFNMVSPWRAAPTDAEGRQSYTLQEGQFRINEEFYSERLDDRFRAINEAGLLAVPVLCWAHRQGDAGVELNEAQLIELIRFEVERYKDMQVFWILAGDNRYQSESAERWRRIGRAVFQAKSHPLVTTHPTGENWPWQQWEQEPWLTVLGYQSGHGDSDKTWHWLHHGPPAEYGRRSNWTRPSINLEAPYEGHNGYQSRQPHSAASVRRAVYWSLLIAPPAGVTYGGHGVWSWHTKPGAEPTDHPGSGVAMPWHKALYLPGAEQMGYVRRLFESIAWTELRPAPQWVVQPAEAQPTTFVACAATPDRRTIVLYLPANASWQFTDAAKIQEQYSQTWFDPSQGVFVIDTDTASSTPPDPATDWVLVLRQRDAERP